MWKNQMKNGTGIEIAEEWLYHMGVPEELIHEFASEGLQHGSLLHALYHKLLHGS